MFLKINNQVFVKREKSHRAADLMMTQMFKVYKDTQNRERTQGDKKLVFQKIR